MKKELLDCDTCKKEVEEKELTWVNTPYGEACICEECLNYSEKLVKKSV